jgi:hypothetical protein
MSEVELFIIDENSLPTVRGDRGDIEVYRSLVGTTTERGELWSEIPMNRADLIDALMAIDGKVGGTKFLPVLALNNSPRNVLGDHPRTPPFGYFSPEQVRDLSKCFRILTADAIFDLERQGRAVSDVLYAFQSAAEAAAQRGAALVVLHQPQQEN